MRQPFEKYYWWRFLLGAWCIMLITLQPLSKLLLLASYSCNIQYYTNVLCENRDKPALMCHGKCKLRKQMNALGSPIKPQKEDDTRRINVSLIMDFIESPECCPILRLTTFSAQEVCNYPYRSKLLSREGDQVFHPPKG